jgi:RNA polymerase sigma-70 factor (ECF subfamily)
MTDPDRDGVSLVMDRASTAQDMAVFVAPPAEVVDLASRFRAIYEEHFEFVWRCVRRFGVPAAHRDDAVQDAFIAVYRGLGTFEARSTVRTWLYTVARNVALNFHRGTHRRLQSDPADDGVQAVEDHAPGPFEVAARSEAVRAFESIVAGLDEEKREVFVLTEIEQMTAPEIADALQVPLNTVYSRLRLARGEFHRALARLHVRNR